MSIEHRAVSMDEVPLSTPKSGKWRDLLGEFVASGDEAWEVVLNGQRIESAYTGVSAAARACGYPIRCVRRSNKLYVMKVSA